MITQYQWVVETRRIGDGEIVNVKVIKNLRTFKWDRLHEGHVRVVVLKCDTSREVFWAPVGEDYEFVYAYGPDDKPFFMGARGIGPRIPKRFVDLLEATTKEKS
jgi:hypothetical protein